MKKNKINVDEAMEVFEGYGFDAVIFNFYQIRIRHEEHKQFYDWYHTRGTLTMISSEKGTKKITQIYEAEEVAEFITKHLQK